MTKSILIVVGLAGIAPGALLAQGSGTDAAILRGLIDQTARSINAHDPDGVMAHYSKDIIVSYPGVADTTYDLFDRTYRQMMNPSIITRTVPTVDEIVVSGDLAMIRMQWSTTITDKASGNTSSRVAKDLQIWRREHGSWKFYRGMWHHVPPAPKPQ
jgi:ketosteroid isomerase-like protein